MSNEYIVVNTKKDNKAIWSTIASTYTPSVGEVCIIVPTINSLDEHKDDFQKATVGIKIGDGETVFKDLPLLTDVSSIRPDWDETDTSSPNYIWHKPITNSSLILSSEILDLKIDDKTITNIIDNPTIRVFHNDEYYFIKHLDDDNCFTHPYDLLTEEDDTWGHYDIKYNVSEVNHEPRYFYRNNIITNTEYYKLNESDGGYEIRIEEFLKSIFYNILDTQLQYHALFPNYDDKEDVEYAAVVLSGNLTDYLGNHKGQIEHQTLYDIVNETFFRCNDNSLKLSFSGYFYETINGVKNKNYIQKKINESTKTYYEINNEVIIDAATKSLYFRKLRLDHYYEQAHGIQEIVENLIGTTENPITTIKIPFEVNEEMLKNDLFDIEIVTDNDIIEIECDGKSVINSFKYPYNYILDSQRLSEIDKLIKDNNAGFNAAVDGLDETSIEYQEYKNEYLLMDNYLKDLQKQITYNDIHQTSMRVKYHDEIFYEEFLNDENGEVYVESLSLPQKFLLDHKETDIYKIFLDPVEYQWSDKYSASELKPLKQFKFKDELNIKNHINNTKIVVKYDSEYINDDQLFYKTDYYINETENLVVLNLDKWITSDCEIYFDIDYGRIPLTENDYTKEVVIDEDTGDIAEVLYKLKEPLNRETHVAFHKMGKEYVLQYYKEDSDGYYTVDANENGEMIINLNEPIEKVATIYLSKKYDMSFSLSSDNFDIQTGIITLKNPIPQNANVTYRRNSQTGGYLEIVFYYRLRELNSRFLSSLKPDWNANGIDDPNYIANRPLWIDTVNNETRIVMESGNPELNYRYNNHQSHYLEFFQELILETVDLLDYEVSLSGLGQQIKELQEKVARFEYYFGEWQVPGFEEYGKGVLELIKSILEWLKRLQDELNRKTEIHIGTNPPPEDGLNKYKMWVNTDTNNGNGLIYYYHEGMSKWIPVSALWSESADADALD